MKNDKTYIHSGFKNKYLESKEEYLNQFLATAKPDTLESETVKNAAERAWKNRDFEIEMYWKRATYFWTFIAATLVGYTALITSKVPIAFYQLELILICLGLFLSVIWYLVNRSSKFWQENWEYHIDMLEDFYTGPLYKTVKTNSKHSVSKLNLLVSVFMIFVWIGLGIHYCDEHFIFHKPENFEASKDIDKYSICIIAFTTILLFIALYKRTRQNDNENVGFTYRDRF